MSVRDVMTPGRVGVVLIAVIAGCHREQEETRPGSLFPAAGRIVYQCAGKTWQINADDGSGTTLIADGVLENASVGTYAGIRWGLRVKETGEVYHVRHSNGTVTVLPQRDLFAQPYLVEPMAAQNLEGSEVQLTNFYGTYLVESAHWCRSNMSGDDAFISLLTKDISGFVRETHEGRSTLLVSGEEGSLGGGVATILRLHIKGEGLGNIRAPLAPEAPECERVLVGHDGHALLLHAWSPKGNRLAFLSHEATSIYVADVSSPPVSTADAIAVPNTRYATFDEHAWSPDGERIMYRTGSTIWSVNALNFERDLLLDESSLLDSVSARVLRQALVGNRWPQAFAYCRVYQPRWSPDGRQIAYILERQAGSHYSDGLFRTRRSDGATVPLTGDPDKRLSRDACFWVE